MLQAKASWIKRVAKRGFRLFVATLMILQTLWIPNSALAEGSVFAFRGYGAENMSSDSLSYTTSDASVSGRNVTIAPLSAEGEAIGLVNLNEPGCDISQSVDLGGLEISFSTVSNIALEGDNGVDNDVPTAKIYFCSTDEIGSEISRVTLTKADGTIAGNETLSSGASIPKGTRSIFISLNGKNKTGNNTVTFSDTSLVIRDAGAPTCSASYNQNWTNADVTVTINAADSDAGLEGIYVNDLRMTGTSPYVFTISANNTSFSAYAMDLAGKKSDVVTGTIDHIDKTTPAAPSEVPLSSSAWTNTDVSVLMPALGASTGSPERYVYQIGSGAWTDLPDGFSIKQEGSTTIRVAVADAAGNRSNSAQATAKIDKSAPTISNAVITSGSSSARVDISASEVGASGLQKFCYAEGKQTTDYFTTGGTYIVGSTFTVNVGGDYTIFASDYAGNYSLKEISITTAPSFDPISDVTVEEDTPQNVKLFVSDAESSVGELTISVSVSENDLLDRVELIQTETEASLNIVPSANLSGGPVTITVDVEDPSGQKVSRSFGVTVLGANDDPVAKDDSATLDEDGVIEIDVLANDSDTADNDTVSISDVGTAKNGTTLLVLGKIRYTPDENFAGTDSFSYTISDGHGGTGTATVYITVNQANDAPTTKDDTAATAEDTTISIDVLANDSDIDRLTNEDEAISLYSCGNGANGSTQIVGTMIEYTPNADFNGTDTFTYTISDLAGLTTEGTVSVTVSPEADAPRFKDLMSEYTMDEDAVAYEIAFEISDVETPQDSLMLQAASLNGELLDQTGIEITGLADDSPAVKLLLTPVKNMFGDVNIKLTLGDGFDTVEQTITVHINNVNDAPRAGSDTRTYTEDAAYVDLSIASLLAKHSDIEKDTITFAGIVSQPLVGSIDVIDDTTIRYTPAKDYDGVCSFTYYITDGSAMTLATCTLEAIGVNDAPSIDISGAQIDGVEDTLIIIPFLVSDNESNPADLSVIVASGDDSIVTTDGIKIVKNADGNGEVQITPEQDANGTVNVTLTVSDGEAQASDSVDLVFAPTQDAPIAVEDHVYVHYTTSRTFSVLENDHDVDGDVLTIIPDKATLPGTLTFDEETQMFTYVPAIGESKISTFTYTITDGKATSSAEVKLDVISETHAPVITAIDSRYINEDGTVSGIAFSVSDEDIGDTARISVSSGNKTLLPEDEEHIVVTPGTGGNYTLALTPAVDQSGYVSVTVTVTDSTELSDSTTFYLYVIGQNDAPVCADDSFTMDEDGSLVLNFIGNDTDPDGDTIWLSSLSAAAHGYIEHTGSDYTYYPYGDWSGTETLTYRASDGRATDEARATITVNPVNDAPVAWSDWRTLPNEVGNESVTIPALSNDYDVDTGDVIHIVEIVTQPTYGTATIGDNGNIIYTRNAISPNPNGADSFEYRIIDRASDEVEGCRSATAHVYIGVTYYGALNTYGRSVYCFEDDAAFDINLTVDNPGMIDYTLTVNTPTTLGSFEVLDNNTVRFTPALNQYGYAAITYTVEKVGGGEKDTGTIWLRVYPVNDLPVITSAPASVTMNEDTSGGYSFNVDFHDDDCANRYLYFYVYTQSAETTAPIPFMTSYSVTDTTGGKQVTVKTADNVNGTGKIVVGVSDGMTYDEAVIDLNVLPVDDAPLVKNVSKTIREDSSVTFASPGSDSEVDGETIKETIDPSHAPQHGRATINPNRTITYVPDADFNGVEVFNVIVADQTEAALSAIATVTITVLPVNDPPEIFDLDYYQTTLEDKEKDVTLTVRDVDNILTDPSHYTLTSEDQTLVKSENITISSVEGEQMSIHILPEANAYGTVKINIIASDGSLTAKGAFSLKIVAVNDLPKAENDTATVDEVTSTGAEVKPPKTTKVIVLLLNDTDVEDVKPRIVALTNIPAGVTVANKGDGTVLVSVDGDYSGLVAFDYTVMDRAGATASAHVTLTVNAVNDPPRAKADSVTIFEDATPLVDVLNNDSDPEGDALSIQSVGKATHGTTEISGTKVLYTPDENYFGTDSFSYTVSDGNGGVASASVNITIKPVNDAPTVAKHATSAGDWEMYEDVPKSFNFVVADAESPTNNLIIKITSDKQELVKNTQIALSTNADGYKTIRVTPVTNASGTLNLKLWVSDGLLQAESIIPLTIISVNDAPVITAPAQTTKEDTMLTGSATATDADGDNVKFYVSEAPEHGTVVVRIDGTYDYTPFTDYNGVDSFVICADDEQESNRYGYATVHITVKPDGDAPVALDDEVTLNEDTPTTVSVLANDSDTDVAYGDKIAILRVSTPAHGTTTIDGETILYTPKSDYNGADSFNYTITDLDGKTDTANVSVTILPINDAPRGGDDTATVLEDHSVDIAVTVNDDVDETTNPDLEDVTILSVDTPLHGTASYSADKKTITYTPNADWFSPEGEPEVFYYTAKDAEGLTERFAVSVSVTSVNDLPVITPETLPEVSTNEDTLSSAITFAVSDVETAAGSLTVTATHLNGVLLPPMSVTPDANGNCSFTVLPNLNRVGNTMITVRVTDADGGQDTATFKFTVNPVNDKPVPGNDSFTVAEDASYTADVLANDDVDFLANNGGDTLTLLSIATPQYGKATIVGNKLYYVPKADRDTSVSYQDVFTYTMKDADGNECTPTVTVTVTPVNDAPTISTIADVTNIQEDASNGTGDVGFSVTDEEDDDDTLTVSIACNNTTLFPLSNISITNPTGDETGSLRTVKAIPAANQFGTATITLTVMDHDKATASTSFDVTVDSVNDEPLNGDKSFTVVEDVERELDVLTDIDPDYASTPDYITISAIAVNPSHGTARVAEDGKSIYYKTAQDSNAADTFDYTIHDAYGNADYTFTVTIDVTPVNDAPVIHYAGNAEYTIFEATQINDIPFTVTDVDNVTYAGGEDTVEVMLSAKSSNTLLLLNGIKIDTLTGDNRDIDLKPYLKWNGKTTVTITATDPGGLKGTASFSLIVNNVNDTPVAADDTFTIPEDQTSTLDVLHNDTDADLTTNPDTESIKVNSVTDNDPNAEITKSADGLSVTIVPNANYNGPVSFTYTTSDKLNAVSNTATVTVTVQQVNDAPVTTSDTTTTNEDTAVSIYVLDNDTDIDKQSGLNARPQDEILSVVLTGGGLTAPAHGSITTDGTKITYTPTANYNGTDTFQYYCSDGETTTKGTVSLTIYQVNDPPVANANTVNTLEDTPTALVDVLGNDTDVDIDTTLNKNVLHLRSEFSIDSATVTNPAHGTVEIISNKLKFTPALNWFGTEVVNYTMKDGHTGTASSKLTVTVTAVNDPPVIDSAPENLDLIEDGVNGVTSVTVSDVETAVGSLTIAATNSTNPTLIGTSDVVVTGTGATRTVTVNPKNDQNGTAVITLTLSDGNKSSTVQFTVNVAPANDAPVATDKNLPINEDAALMTFDKALLADDVDMHTNTDSLTLSITTAASHGTAAIDTNGNVTYIPNANFNGTDSFVYTATDQEGAKDVGTFSITIAQVNDAPEPENDSKTTTEDVAVDILVLSNDDDIDKDANLNANPLAEIHSVVIGVEGLQLPSHGKIATDGTKITYTPNKDYNGTDKFEYFCSDGEAQTKASVTVTITQEDDSPVGTPDEVTIDEGSATGFINVLANDTDVDLDETLNLGTLHSRDTFHITSARVMGVPCGTVEVVDNKVKFTPYTDWNGTAVIFYTFDDGYGLIATTALRVYVTSINDLPEFTLAPEDLDLIEDGADGVTSVDLSDVETDPASLKLTVTESSNPTLVGTGDVVITGTGATRTITVNPKDNQNGTAVITLTLEDGDKVTTTVKFTVVVSPVNDDPVAVDKDLTIDEDAALMTFDKALLADDVDILTNEDSLTLSITTAASHGTALIDTNGNVTYIPTANFNGTDSFVYTVTDELGGKDTESFTFTIGQVNDAPTAGNDLDNTTKEDKAFDIFVLSNDDDIDKDALLNANPELESIEVVVGVDGLKLPVHGTIATDGTKITYTPNKDYNGTDSFEYYCSDGTAMTKASVAVTITQVNDSPIAAPDETTTQEDTPTAWIDVMANDTDVDLNPLLNENNLLSRDKFTVNWIDVSDDSSGTAVLVDNKIQFTPALNWSGTAYILYYLDDGYGSSCITSLAVVVESENDAPVFTTAPSNLELLEDGIDGVTSIVVSDPETLSSALKTTVTETDNPTLIDISDVVITGTGATRTITVNPKDNQNGTAVITLTLEDGDKVTTTVKFTVVVSPVNDDPVAVDKDLTIDEDAALMTFDKALLADDVDILTNEDSLTLSITTAASHGTAAIDTNGNVTYIPTANFNGTDSFVYTVTDELGGKDTETFTFTIGQVNDAPTAGDDLDNTTKEDTPVDIYVLGNDDDIDKDETLNANPELESIEVVIGETGLTAPTHGAITTDGVKITYTPNKDYNGTDSFEYYCSDGTAMTKATVAVTITQVNDSPVANDDSELTDEDTPVSVDVLKNDTDVDTVSELNQNKLHSKDDFYIDSCSLFGAENGTVVIEGASIRFTPAANFFGPQMIKYVLKDGNGGTSTGTLMIFVGPQNDPPQASDDVMSAKEDNTASVNVLENDTDNDPGDTQTFVKFTELPAVLHGEFTTNANGDVSFEPDENYNGSFEATYQMRDAAGSLDTAKLTVTITPVNDAPIANDSTAETNEDNSTAIDVSSLVGDVDIATNDDTIAVSVAKAGEPAHGSISVSGTVITYTPDDNFNGADEITYTVTDAQGLTDTGKLTITIRPTNDAPVAGDDEKGTNEDTAVEISVLANDADIDTDEALNLTPAAAPYIDSVTNGAHGSATTNGSVIEYTPDANYNGVDTIKYVLADGMERVEASVTITIAQVNDEIQALDDVDETNDEDPVTVDVLANDTDVDTDPALNEDELHLADSFSITEVGTPEHGTASIVSKWIEYLPEDRFAGTDSFTYTVSDGHGSTATATVTITVHSVNDPPVIVEVLSPKGGERVGTGSTVPVEWTAFDIDGDALTYRLEYFDGKDWLLVNNDLTQTKYLFAIPSSLGSVDGLKFRVNARDREFTSDYGYSGALHVDQDAPKGVIVTMKTADGRAYTAGTWTNQTVTVQASNAVDASKVVYIYEMDVRASATKGGPDAVSKTAAVEGGIKTSASSGTTPEPMLSMDVVSGVHTVHITAVDEYGNATYVGAYLARVDKQQPAVPEIRESIAGGNVVLTLTMNADPGNSGNDKLTLPDNTVVKASGNPTYSAAKNGTLNFSLTDVAGNRRNFTYTVTTADVSKPVITLDAGAYRIGTKTQSGIKATLTFTDAESEILNRGYMITSGSTPSGTYRTYEGALSMTTPGTYYVHAFAKNAFGLATYETFGPFIIEAAEAPAGEATPAPTPVPEVGDVVVDKGDVEEIPGDTVAIRIPGQEWSETLTLEGVGPGTYLIEAMDADGNVRTVEVRVTMRDIIARSLRSGADKITISAVAVMALCVLLILALLAGHNITVVVNGSEKKLRTFRRIMFKKKELVIQLSEKQLAGGRACNVKIAKSLSKNMRGNTVIVTMRGVEVLREQIPADYDEAFKRTIRIAD